VSDKDAGDYVEIREELSSEDIDRSYGNNPYYFYTHEDKNHDSK
jgi:hypothetical protein